MSVLAEMENHNNISLLVNGEEAFKQIIARIEGSKNSIHINMFIWRDDRIGNELTLALLDAANRGVKVYISKDKLGAIFEKSEENKQSFFHKGFDLKLSFKSFFCDKFYPMKGKTKTIKQQPNLMLDVLLNQSNIMVDSNEVKGDHSKFFIFDNEVLIIGGINIEDKEIYCDVEGKFYYDYMVEVDNKELVKRFKRRLNNEEGFNEGKIIEFIFNNKHNGEKIFEAKKFIMNILSSTEKSVHIIMAYLGDKDITDKIIEMANRGIFVTIVIPGEANVQDDLNKSIIKRIMIMTNNKVIVYFCNNMVHAKLIRVDDKLLTLGSINLNKQAMENLLELNILINSYDEGLNDILDDSINKIISDSKEVKDSSEIKYNIIRSFLEKVTC